MSECCNDLFELRELLEEMPAEFEALWSCRVENEGFALPNEAGDEGLGLKHGRENVGEPSEPLHTQVLVFWISALVDHPSAAPYQILSLFHKVWESENIFKMFPPAPSDFQDLRVEFSV